ncbi:hypothetical protein [Aliiglaciecola litoralis]|uniref:YubB ferredoxin-like domain-containing protein n=1 Tax=Aliiglaciecola litoralis TaxID=582857 RepID=A0ABP3X8A1_9ALTE
MAHNTMHLPSELIRDLIDVFESSNTPFRLIEEDKSKEECFDKLNLLAPFNSWSYIDWSKVVGQTTWEFDNWEEQSKSVNDCLSKLPKSGKVFVLWFNALKPVLEIEVAVFRLHAMDIFSECSDTWVYDCAGKFVLECHHDGKLSFYTPGAT